MKVTGKNAFYAFRHESGGHRFQRIPPTEKRGRVHTSTITVAVLMDTKQESVFLDPKDLEESFTRGSGKGGQHRNKTDTCVLLTHKPSGLSVRVDGGRSQYINRQTALEILHTRLQEQKISTAIQERNHQRRDSIGSGMRGDKVRTVALQRDSVTDHNTGKTISAKLYLRGNLRLLW